MAAVAVGDRSCVSDIGDVPGDQALCKEFSDGTSLASSGPVTTLLLLLGFNAVLAIEMPSTTPDSRFTSRLMETVGVILQLGIGLGLGL